eukprot:125204-Chlamydomonas_euryale.AAC.1
MLSYMHGHESGRQLGRLGRVKVKHNMQAALECQRRHVTAHTSLPASPCPHLLATPLCPHLLADADAGHNCLA